MCEQCYNSCNSIKFWREHSNQQSEEIRTTKRALWLTRAMRAELQWAFLEEEFPLFMKEEIEKWKLVERKCREYAERFK